MAYVEYDPQSGIFSWFNRDRSRYIPMSDESPDFYRVEDVNYFSQSGLKRFGFKTAQFKLLGDPCKTIPNPRYPSGQPMKLWSEAIANEIVPF